MWVLPRTRWSRLWIRAVAGSRSEIHPAVDADRLAGDVGVPRQQYGDIAALLHAPEAADRNHVGLEVGIRGGHLGGDERRRDRVDGDAFLREHARVTLGGGDDTALGGGVVDRQGAAGLCGHR